MLKITIKGNPVTKKNSSRIARNGDRLYVLPSKPYHDYRQYALWQIPGSARKLIDFPVNVQCVYYMHTRRKVDLVNLLEATCDILVDAKVLDDDNSQIVVSHDGSHVGYSKDNPRVEITITEAD